MDVRQSVAKFIAPWKYASVGSARCLLPLGIGWQPPASPATKRFGIRLQHKRHRQIVFTGRERMAALEFLVAAIGDLQFVDVERW